MIMSCADCGLFIICLQRGHKQMILLVFDLEVCTVRFSVHKQNNRKLRVLCKFLSAWRALLADSYGETEYLQQSDKSPLHLLLLSCFIAYHEMNRNNE